MARRAFILASIAVALIFAPHGSTLLAPPPLSLSNRIADALDAPAAPFPEEARSLRELATFLDARFGVVRDASAYDVLDHIDPALAAPIARLMGALLAAADTRDAAFAGIPTRELLSHLESESDPGALALAIRTNGAALRAATASLLATVDQVLPELQAVRDGLSAVQVALAGPPLVDLAPALVLDPLGLDTLYTKDAALALDLGGADIYDMNAGGSLIGIFPSGDPSTFQIDALGLAAVGGEFEDAIVSLTASLALDLAGDDQYGVRRTARGLDAGCTSASIIRRIVMQGAGSGGIGILVDAGGNDFYDAKTLSQGMGHIAGVGVLADLGGDDVYKAIRSSQGSGLLGGSGVFLDASGADQHVFASPAGGIFNVDAGQCDATARLGLGAGVLAATGDFLDDGGNDIYQIGSQGLGFGNLGHGTFVDRQGTDNYNGFPGRGNNQLTPGALSVFVDQ